MRAGLPYEQGTVDLVRALHDGLRAEIGKMQHSQYYRGAPGRMAAPADFDADALACDFGKRFPALDRLDLDRLVGTAVYFYYLR